MTIQEIVLGTPDLDKLIVVGYYQGVLKKIIKSLKYQHYLEAARICGEIIFYCQTFPECLSIVPVPLHFRRLQDRGFNQAEEIAKHLSVLSQIPVQNLLVREKHLSPQALVKDPELRKSRVSGVFQINQPLIADKIIPNSILLIDDVTTTGATLNECAKVLKIAGVERVYGLVLAHGR